MEGGEVAWDVGGLLGVEQDGVNDEPMEESIQLTPGGDEVPLEGEAGLDDDVEEAEEELDSLQNQAGERSSCSKNAGGRRTLVVSILPKQECKNLKSGRL